MSSFVGLRIPDDGRGASWSTGKAGGSAETSRAQVAHRQQRRLTDAGSPKAGHSCPYQGWLPRLVIQKAVEIAEVAATNRRGKLAPEFAAAALGKAAGVVRFAIGA